MPSSSETTSNDGDEPTPPKPKGRGGLRPLAALELLHNGTALSSSATPCQEPQIPARGSAGLLGQAPRSRELGTRDSEADSRSEYDRPVYGIDERPATWWECALFGWQHTLVDISPFVLPLAVAGALGMTSGETADLINFGLVAMAVATLLQTTIGNRLPIIQGPSATLTGTLAPVASQIGGPAMWGGVFAGGLVEMLIGATRLVGLLRRFLPASVSGAVIVTIGLSLGQLAIRLAVGDGAVSGFAWASSVVLAIFLLQIVGRRMSGKLGGLLARGSIFLVIWTFGLGLGSLLGQVDWALVADKPWFALPRLFPYGGPGFGWSFSFAAIAVILVGYFGSMVESLGDYAATCEVAGVEYRRKHMNRGIFAEGLGSLVSAVLGGLPCTSYTQNIGIIATTRVASRFVVQVAAFFLLVYGLCPKFGALLVAMPRAVLGGVFVVVCGMIVVSGIRLIGSAGAGEARTGAGRHVGLVVGTTLVVATTLPGYVRGVLGAEWLEGVPAMVGLLVGNSVVLAVIVGVGANLLVEALMGSGER